MQKKILKKVRAIIYDIKDGQPYFLILKRTLRWQGWEAVKETIEPGENIKEALVRGIKEETGIEEFEIIRSLNKQEEWQTLGNNYKVVDTFLVKMDMNQELSLKQRIVEHDDYQWVDKKTAIEKLTHSESKNLLKELEL